MAKHSIPLFAALQSYSPSMLSADIIAGLTVGIILIPQALAYGLLAGVPPIYGLYSALIPMIIYAFFGSSSFLSIGPVAVTAILMFSSVSKLHEPFTEVYIQQVILLGFYVGVFQIILSFLKVGQLIKHLPKVVLSGFVQAAAILIIISQFSNAFGIAVPGELSALGAVWYLLNHVVEINLLTIGFFGISLIIILWVNIKNSRFPIALVIVAIAILLSYYFELNTLGLNIIGDIPRGFPALIIPSFETSSFMKLLPSIFAVTFIGYVGSVGLVLSFEHLQKGNRIETNKELFALGLAKLIGAFFQSIPSTGSFSRTAINVTAGAKTQISSLITVVLLCLTILFITPLFYYLPNAVLAAIITHSVLSLLRSEEIKILWEENKIEFIVFTSTFILTLLIGLEIGVVGGILLYYVLVKAVSYFFKPKKSLE